MGFIMTVLGSIPSSGLGMILPHEHLFTDLRGPAAEGYAQADIAHVVERLRPYIEEIKALRVTALVEATPLGVGRNIHAVRAVAEAADFPIVAATGAYREPFVPAELRALSQAALAEWMVRELTEGIEGTGVRAGFIKLCATDEGLTPLEERLLRAAAQASRATGAAIASHTKRGAVALRQVEILAEEGVEARRFIWVHAHCEPDVELQLRLARRGVFLEYDAIGQPGLADELFIGLLRRAWDAHCSARVLLSHDAGYYRPGEPNAPIRGFGYLMQAFLPKLRQAGFDETAIRTLVEDNPKHAFQW